MSTSGFQAPSANRRALGRAGFSLVELIATIAIIALLTAITVSLVGDDPGSAKNAKLQSDIATLNQMIAIYTSDGTSLSGQKTPEAVLEKLKRVRPESEWKGNVGVASGRLIDTRLQARPTTAPDSDNNPRARWNSKSQRFEITTAGGTAISEFYLDESLASVDLPTDSTRAKNLVTFNSSNKGWVWNAGPNPQPAHLAPRSGSPSVGAGGFDPNETAPGSSDPPPDNPGGGGGGPVDPGPSGPIITKLPRPIISPPGGTFAFQSFPATVSISSNGAIPEASQLLYRIGGGAWLPYTGPIPLTPAMSLQAVNQTTRPAEYAMSLINTQTYYRLTGSFSGTGDGNWGNAIGGTNLVTNINNNGGTDGTTTFKHGNTKLDLGNGEYLDAGVENVLSFKPEQFDTIKPNTWFDFGELTMLNGTTFYNSEATGVTLSVNLKLTQPALDFTTHIALGFESTDNTSDRLASADSVELKNPTTDVHITIDGVEYRLELSWATLDPGAGVVDGNKFRIYEGATAQAVLRARFTSNH